jgi:histidinol-phosphate phosphatase family protein
MKNMIITNTSALFLDRDGVINEELPGEYVKTPGEFRFRPFAPESIHQLSQYFNKIFIVTNQRGIGRGLMTENDLAGVHAYMMKQFEYAYARIDRIYYCTAINNEHPDRKPNAGMAFRAKYDFPQIDLSTSVMVGNKPGDMEFGRNAGMQTVFITSTNPPYELPHPMVDYQFEGLSQFSHFVPKVK